MEFLMILAGVSLVSLLLARLGILVFSAYQESQQRTAQQRLSQQRIYAQIDQARESHDQARLAWNGFRKFVVDRKIQEAKDICSFYLVPHDRKNLPNFRPGQYLTFRLNIPGREKPVVRCYSLSDALRKNIYRVTIKRVDSPSDQPMLPPGLVSNFFHEQIHEGDILDVQAARGQFFMLPEDQRPAVLIAGGVGVTPLLSMVNAVADQQTGREILLFYGTRNGREHAFREHLERLTELHGNIRLVVVYSRPGSEDVEGEGHVFHHTGRIDIRLIRSYLSSTNYDFYICGPPSMMESLVPQLIKWGVADRNVHREAFGPATVSKSITANTAKRKANPCKVTFAKSGTECNWNDEAENLLDFAEQNGVTLEFGCRAGSCGACTVAVKSGSVTCIDEAAMPEEGSCLTCVSIPEGDVTLDA